LYNGKALLKTQTPTRSSTSFKEGKPTELYAGTGSMIYKKIAGMIRLAFSAEKKIQCIAEAIPKGIEG